MYSKLNKATGQRKALMRSLATQLLWNGKITTTQARAKQIQPVVEKIITLAIKEYNNNVTVTKEVVEKKYDNKGNATASKVKRDVINDAPSKLHARRQMMSYLYDIPEPKGEKESKGDYAKRTREVKHPLIEKIFREYAPKYDKRAKDLGTGGGYTRIVKLGQRRGDAAEIVILELV